MCVVSIAHATDHRRPLLSVCSENAFIVQPASLLVECLPSMSEALGSVSNNWLLFYSAVVLSIWEVTPGGPEVSLGYIVRLRLAWEL